MGGVEETHAVAVFKTYSNLYSMISQQTLFQFQMLGYMQPIIWQHSSCYVLGIFRTGENELLWSTVDFHVGGGPWQLSVKVKDVDGLK